MKLSLSGDIELNPGTVQNNIEHMAVALPSSRLLESRFLQLGFFRAVSHQLYGDPNFHLSIRAAGIEYMRDNPERNTDFSWVEYLTNMSRKGTWSDALIIHAVADKLNLRIHIVESHQHFAPFNVVEPVNSMQEPRLIYLGGPWAFRSFKIQSNRKLNSPLECYFNFPFVHDIHFVLIN